MALPRPGVFGRTIRLALATLTLWTAWSTAMDGPTYWTGVDVSLLPASIVVVFSSWVVNGIVGRSWGQRPTLLLAVGAAVAAATGAWTGDPMGPILGTYLWLWILAVTLPLGTALALAAGLGTPGCEMRSFAHLAALVDGRDPKTIACPGWIDRCDAIRLR